MTEKEVLDYLKEQNLVILKYEEYLKMSQMLSNWRPSEKQIECLTVGTMKLQESGYNVSILESLIDDLKRL